MLVVIALGRLFFSEVLRFVAYLYEREHILTDAPVLSSRYIYLCLGYTLTRPNRL